MSDYDKIRALIPQKELEMNCLATDVYILRLLAKQQMEKQIRERDFNQQIIGLFILLPLFAVLLGIIVRII